VVNFPPLRNVSEPSKIEQAAEIMKTLGISGQQLQKINLGPGVVGRNSSIAWAFEIVAFAGVIGGIWLHSPYIVGLSVGGGILVGLAIAMGNIYFGNKNPGAAILEGGHFLVYQHLLQQMAARGEAVIESAPAVTAPPLLPANDDKSLGKGEEGP
jgi:hypothetical protein